MAMRRRGKRFTLVGDSSPPPLAEQQQQQRRAASPAPASAATVSSKQQQSATVEQQVRYDESDTDSETLSSDDDDDEEQQQVAPVVASKRLIAAAKVAPPVVSKAPVQQEQQRRVRVAVDPALQPRASQTCALCCARLRAPAEAFVQYECGHVFHARCALRSQAGRGYCSTCVPAYSPVAGEPPALRGGVGAMVPVDFGDDYAAAALIRHHESELKQQADSGGDDGVRRAAAADVVRMTRELHGAQMAMRRAAEGTPAAAASGSFFSRIFARRGGAEASAAATAVVTPPTQYGDADALWLGNVARPTLVAPLPQGGPVVAMTMSDEQFDALVVHASPRTLLDMGLDAMALMSDDRITAELLIGYMRYSAADLCVLGFRWPHLLGRLALDARQLRERRNDALSPASMVRFFGVTFGELLRGPCGGNIDTFVSLGYAAADLRELQTTAVELAAAGLRLKHIQQEPFSLMTLDGWRRDLQLASLEPLRRMLLTPPNLRSPPFSWTHEQISAAFGATEWDAFQKEFFDEMQQRRTPAGGAPAAPASGVQRGGGRR